MCLLKKCATKSALVFSAKKSLDFPKTLLIFIYFANVAEKQTHYLHSFYLLLPRQFGHLLDG